MVMGSCGGTPEWGGRLHAQGKVILRQSGYVAGDEITLEEIIQKALNP